MSSLYSIKAYTVHNRETKSCLNCSKYFVPRKSHPKYVEGHTTQTWCSKECYLTLYPPVKKVRECRICSIEFTPERKNSTLCGKPECKREAERARARERWANFTPEQKEAKRARARERWANFTPEQREAYLKAQRERRANFTPEQKEAERARARERYQNLTPEEKEAWKKYKREWYQNFTPEEKEAYLKAQRERRANFTPEEKEAWKKYKREWYHKKKQATPRIGDFGAN